VAKGINKVIVIGNVGKDPEIHNTASGNVVATFSLAVNEKWKDSNGEMQEQTEWVRCVAFNKLGEVVQNWIKKGQQLYVEGKMSTRKWQGQDGQDRYTTEVIVKELQMLGRREEGGQSAAPQQQGFRQPQAAAAAAPAQQAEFTDDDIPF